MKCHLSTQCLFRKTATCLRFYPVLVASLALAEMFGGDMAADGAGAGKDLTGIDKSGYHLFNPTPAKFLRELTTDRPDKTESPYTVDAGHVQVEMDLVNYSYDRDTSAGGDVRVHDWAIAPVNFKLGILNNLDLQTMVNVRNQAMTDDRVAGTRLHQSGFGDVTSRVKLNFWGNDGGKTAFGIMPFVKYPTSQDGLGNNSVEGGVIVPFGMELPGGWSLGMMTEFDFMRNSAARGHHIEYVNSITFGHDIIGKLGGYLEFWSLVSDETGTDWQGSLDVGLTYPIGDNVQLDMGSNFGITRSADDVNPFVGVSFRF